MERTYVGGRVDDRLAAPPLFQVWNDEDDPASYHPDEGLRDAVNVALALGQPLLLTGDPGTGKTQLAYSLAYDLGAGDPLVFDTKSDTTAQDLFYRYDTLRHFHDVQLARRPVLGVGGAGKPANGNAPPGEVDGNAPQGEADGNSLEDEANGKAAAGEAEGERPILKYLHFQALGLAILRAMDPSVTGRFLPVALRVPEPRRSVVLVDEIDKAPRDVPNDLLREIEAMTFQVREAGADGFPVFRAEARYRPIVVLTSNSEKNLPDAFLRRCVFYHLERPGAEQLREIVRLRLGGKGRRQREAETAGTPAAPAPAPLAPPPQAVVDSAIAEFLQIRDLPLKKKPATAEFLGWVRLLGQLGLDVRRDRATRGGEIAVSYSVLAKTLEDLALLRDRLRTA